MPSKLHAPVINTYSLSTDFFFFFFLIMERDNLCKKNSNRQEKEEEEEVMNADETKLLKLIDLINNTIFKQYTHKKVVE